LHFVYDGWLTRYVRQEKEAGFLIESC